MVFPDDIGKPPLVHVWPRASSRGHAELGLVGRLGDDQIRQCVPSIDGCMPPRGVAGGKVWRRNYPLRSPSCVSGQLVYDDDGSDLPLSPAAVARLVASGRNAAAAAVRERDGGLLVRVSPTLGAERLWHAVFVDRARSRGWRCLMTTKGAWSTRRCAETAARGWTWCPKRRLGRPVCRGSRCRCTLVSHFMRRLFHGCCRTHALSATAPQAAAALPASWHAGTVCSYWCGSAAAFSFPCRVLATRGNTVGPARAGDVEDALCVVMWPIVCYVYAQIPTRVSVLSDAHVGAPGSVRVRCADGSRRATGTIAHVLAISLVLGAYMLFIVAVPEVRATRWSVSCS